MECPYCHAANPDTASVCTNCTTRFPMGDQDADGPATWSPTTGAAGPPGGPYDDLFHGLKTAHQVGGKYEIALELGRGGMGIVYKARDLQLQRWVALKFLPPRLADSEELRERFLVEARAAAALSHPNICVIHEVGDDAGQPYIAMEYVEGESLRHRIDRQPLSPNEAVALFSQVAAGLEEAHHKGIVHRDIKSANIMVTSQGQAKIMDFGLAKAQDPGGGRVFRPGETAGPEGPASTDSPTMMPPVVTATGTVLGTVAYMSPEQALGKDLDARTDLFSLGVVLYEMATGRRPFRGDSSSPMGMLRLTKTLTTAPRRPLDGPSTTPRRPLDAPSTPPRRHPSTTPLEDPPLTPGVVGHSLSPN
jgi:serine/threonine protein kinase